MSTPIKRRIEISVSPVLPQQYAVLCDRSPDYIRGFVESNPECCILPFFTKSVDDVPDFSNFGDMRVAQPMYVGNLKPIRSAIRQCVDIAFGNCWPVTCVADDSAVLAEDR